jgi:DHA2 family multidrug resistance protein-like MFS transporter
MQDIQREEAPKAGPRDWIGLAIIALPCLIYSMDLTVLYLAVPEITAELHPSASGLLWISDIYGFFVAGSLITMGTLGDRIGRRRVLLIGAGAFAVTSVLAAYAASTQTLIVARALQGIAGATLAPSTLSLIRNMFLDDRQRTKAIGIWVASFSIGAVIGPLVGGIVLAHFWWGAVFLLNVPVMLALIVLGPFLLPEFREPDAGRLDILSAAQSAIAVLSVIYGLKRIAEDGWAAVPLLSILAGVLVGFAFIRRQRRLADPLIDVELFKTRAISAALTLNIIGLFMVLGTFLFIAQYLQLVLGMGPMRAAFWNAPFGVVFAIGSLAAPALLRRFRPAMIVASGLLLAAAGYALLTQIPHHPSPWFLLAGVLAFSLGVAPLGTITTDIVMGATPPARAGAASAISETSFELGGALGIAVLGSILTVLYRIAITAKELPAMPPDAIEAARDTLGGAVDAAKGLAPDDAVRLLADAREAFTDAFAVTCAVSAIMAIVAAAVAVALLRDAPRQT